MGAAAAADQHHVVHDQVTGRRNDAVARVLLTNHLYTYVAGARGACGDKHVCGARLPMMD